MRGAPLRPRLRLWRPLTSLTLIALLGVAQTPAPAARAEPPRAEPTRAEPPPLKGVAARKAKGFQDERDAPAPGVLSSVLWALGPGLAAHGAGHWSMGDTQSARTLLKVELLGVAALLGVSLAERFAPPSSALGVMGVEGLKHIGWGLFLGSWAADIVGAYQGGLSFSIDRLVGRQRTFSLGYRYLDDTSYNLRHYFTARLAFNEAWGYARLGVDSEYTGLTAGLTLDLGAYLLRPPRLSAEGAPYGGGSGASLALGVSARRWVWGDTRTLQTALSPYVELASPLARLATGLRHTSVYQRVGVGWEGYASGDASAALSQLASSLNPSGAQHQRVTLSLETGIRLNILSETALKIAYLQDPTRDFSPSRWGDGLWGLSDLGLVSEGFWSVEAQVRQSDALDLVAEVMVGDRWSLWLSARYAIRTRKGY